MCDAKSHVAHALKITEKFLITKTEWLCVDINYSVIILAFGIMYMMGYLTGKLAR